MARKKTVIENIDNDNIKNIKQELDKYRDKIYLELDEKINNGIDTLISKKINDYEKRLLRKKKIQLLKKNIIIVLLLLIIVFLVYELYNLKYFDKFLPAINSHIVTNKVDNEEKEDNEIDKDYYINEYKYLLDNILVNDKDISELIINNKLDNSLKLKIAYKNINKEKVNHDDEVINFTSEDIVNSYKTIFNNEDINLETFTYNNTRFMYFNKNFIGYMEDSYEYNIKYEIIDCIVENNSLKFKVLFSQVSDNKLYNLNNELVVDNYQNDSLNNYQDKFELKNIEFILNKNKYYFNKID